MKPGKPLKAVGLACLSMLVACILAELVLRAVLFTRWLPIAALRVPELYAGFSDDDDYWRLHYRLSGEWYPRREVVHPTLGWSQVAVSPADPLGLAQDSLDDLRATTSKRRIPFYGDSYLKGVADPEFSIPRYTTKLFDETNVVDLGVAGYGFDQMYLMYESTRDAFPYSDVLVGVLTEDVDRAVLTTRTYQKPFFKVESGELKLDDKPIDPDPEHYFRESAPRIRSYLFAFLRRRMARFDSRLAERLCRIPEKQAINSGIMDKFLERTRSSGAKLHFVLFYREDDLRTENWEERFLKDALDRRKIPYLDTKPVLLEYANEHHVDPSVLFKEHGHHNNLGNEVISKALHGFLSELGYR